MSKNQRSGSGAHQRHLLTAEQVSEQLGIGLTLFYDLVNRGELPCVRIRPKCIRIKPADLEAFIEKHYEH